MPVITYLRQFNFASMLFRLLLALAVGGVIGYGRSQKQRSAGLRTYMLTCAGAALTVIIAFYERDMLYGVWSQMSAADLKFDGTRLAAGVISGIGFLAAGTIIGVDHQQVSGLTTAIGLFGTACLGLAAGAGFYEAVIPATVLIIIAMETLQPVEIGYKRRLRNITVYVEFEGLRDVTFGTVLLRLLLTFFCGAVIGLERSYKNRPAGIRTHILICIGGAMASMTGLYLYLHANLSTDISRIGASVVSGLGFIGAGTIIKTKDYSIKGLTTAAGLWASGIIGVAIGAGYYEGGLAATVLILLTETCFAGLGKHIKNSPAFHLELRYRNKLALDQVLRYCKDKHLAITDLHVTGDGSSDTPSYDATIPLRARGKFDESALLAHVGAVAGIENVEMEWD